MKKTIVTIAAAMAIVSCMPVGAQNLKLKASATTIATTTESR